MKTYRLGVLDHELTHPLRMEGEELRGHDHVARMFNLEGALQVLFCAQRKEREAEETGRESHGDDMSASEVLAEGKPLTVVGGAEGDETAERAIQLRKGGALGYPEDVF